MQRRKYEEEGTEVTDLQVGPNSDGDALLEVFTTFKQVTQGALKVR
jgi:acyl-CoA-binding protein